MYTRIQRKLRDNRRYSPNGSVIVVDRTGNHKANYMLIVEAMMIVYVIVFTSLRTATKYAKKYELEFKCPMPIYNRQGTNCNTHYKTKEFKS